MDVLLSSDTKELPTVIRKPLTKLVIKIILLSFAETVYYIGVVSEKFVYVAKTECLNILLIFSSSINDFIGFVPHPNSQPLVSDYL
jgi:hypothetical protein